MDKSSIITVLGTVARGLIKSKMGSGLRLNTKCYTYFEETYDVKTEDATNVYLFILSLEPLINQNGYLLHNIDLIDWGTDERGNAVTHVRINIRKLLTSNPDVQVCNEWLSIGGNDFEEWESGLASSELFGFVGKNISDQIEEKFQPSDIGDDFDYGYEKIIHNADTGEIYIQPNAPKKYTIRRR